MIVSDSWHVEEWSVDELLLTLSLFRRLTINLYKLVFKCVEWRTLKWFSWKLLHRMWNFFNKLLTFIGWTFDKGRLNSEKLFTKKTWNNEAFDWVKTEAKVSSNMCVNVLKVNAGQAKRTCSYRCVRNSDFTKRKKRNRATTKNSYSLFTSCKNIFSSLLIWP